MKKICRNLTILLAVFTVFLAAITPADAAKKRVAIMPLEKLFVLSESQQDEETVAQIMSDQLVVAIGDSGNYTVVERTQYDKALKELGFQNLYAEPEYAAEMGAAFGAQYIVVGKITLVKTKAADKRGFIKKIAAKFDTPYRTNIALELRMVDCQTSEVILARTIEGDRGGKTEKDSLYNACKDAAANFMTEVQMLNPFAGRIIEVNGDNIYIDKGLDSGLHKNDVLIISREGKPLEANGKIIGMTEDEIGKAKVIEVTADYSICRVTDSNQVVQKGDIVKRGK